MLENNYFFRFFLSALLIILASQMALATHNRAGQISIKQVGNCTQSLTIEATIITFTKASSRPADRDTLTICWGDGTCERVLRNNGPGNPPSGEILENDTKFNIYTATHTYSTRGTYVVSMTDPNRNGGILNVNYPNSEQIRFHIQTTYTIPNPQFQGCNDTPVLLQPPIDIGCVGRVFTHNPNAYDADNDSLSYHFITPLQDVQQTVPNYLFPDMINSGSNNQLTIDEVTGDIVWNAPQKPGEYNLAMIIVSHRDGEPIDTVVRDMQILIEDCDNQPPIVDTEFDEICVIAGEVIEFPVTVTAPDFEVNQLVRLTALGGPFEVDLSPATLTPVDNSFQNDPLTKIFRWETRCEHISDQYYSVVFRGVDNFFGDTTGLATLKTVRIKVVGPPPQDVDVVAGSGQVELSWEKPYECDQDMISNDGFRGFTVWRREGGNPPPIDTCAPELIGYTKLNFEPTMDSLEGRYYYNDNQVERGRNYCYRVVAEFSQITPNGNYIYNRVESLPSDEVCVQLNRDIPLITKVDVQTTSASDGTIEVCWTKPKAADLDTVNNPGPYTYEVLRATGITNNDSDFLPNGITYTSPTFAQANDTCFVDTQLNTVANPYTYKINFYVAGANQPLGATNPASSVFLNIAPTDEANVLSWTEMVPWENDEYTIFKKNDQGEFEEVATVTGSTYRDQGLINGQEYCYKVQSSGSYRVDGVPSPLINNSQEACQAPFDNVPPCEPELVVDDICDDNIDCTDVELLVNKLDWTNPNETCEDTDDVASYNIYYSATQDGEFTLVGMTNDAADTFFDHQPGESIAGCYAVTALDGLGNESPMSNIVCVENCPIYNLPNAFTPNGDGQNDLFTPYPYCFVAQVEFKVYNRWGEVIFETTDPGINWNGENLRGEQLADATYYYTCMIFAQTVEGIVALPDELSGYIELIRNAR